MKNYSTISEAVNGLRDEGYTEDFNCSKTALNVAENHIRCYTTSSTSINFFASKATLTLRMKRFVYAISSEKYKLKGVLVNGFGISSDSLADEMIKKLKVH